MYKMGKIVGKYWFVWAFTMVLVYAVYGGKLDKRFTLSGVVSEKETVERSLDNIMTGKYQEYLNGLWEEKIPGKNLLIKLRNQMLYSLVGISPNTNVVIGKDKYLFEPAYINNELDQMTNADDEYFNKLQQKLEDFKKIVNQNDKEMYVFITPSKAYFCRDKIPSKYFWIVGNKSDEQVRRRERLKNILDDLQINYVDGTDYIENNKGKYKSPVFYKEGIHWSHVWGTAAACELLSVMDKKGRFHLPKLTVSESKSDVPVYPDTDLYDSLNLMRNAKNEWYVANLEAESEGKDFPNIFVRGGSFLGQSVNALIAFGVFNKDVHLENSYYFTDRYSMTNQLSSFTAYDEMNCDQLLGQSDIYLLEVNDASIPDMSFGFIDYCIQHPEYFDRNYKED